MVADALSHTVFGNKVSTGTLRMDELDVFVLSFKRDFFPRASTGLIYIAMKLSRILAGERTGRVNNIFRNNNTRKDKFSSSNAKQGWIASAGNRSEVVYVQRCPRKKKIADWHMRRQQQMAAIEPTEIPSRTIDWTPLAYLSHIKRRSHDDRFLASH
jgi:hypothetical protein